MSSNIGITLRGLSHGQALEVTRRADAAGIHSVWVPESPGDPDAHTWLASFGGATTSIRLATGVVAAPLRHPIGELMAAKALADITSGRFILGVGSGNQSSLERMGIKFRPPIGYLQEYLTVCRLGLAGSPVAHEGRYFSLKGVSIDPSSYDIPLVVAAHNPMMLKLAGRLADGVLLNVISVEEIKHALDLVRSVDRQPEKPITVAANIITCLARDKREAAVAAKIALTSWCSSEIFRTRLLNLGSPFGAAASVLAEAVKRVGLVEAAAGMPDEMVRTMSIAGDTAWLVQRLDEYRAVGVDLPILSIYPVPLHLAKPFPPVPASGAYEATLQAIDIINTLLSG